jgi:hypothetical protein
MAEQLEAMMSMLGGGGDNPDMSRLLSQMMGDTPRYQNLLGDLDDPAGLSTPPFPPSFPSFPGLPTPTPGKSWVDKIFPLVHVFAMVALAAFVAVWWEPSLRAARWAGQVDAGLASRWGRLLRKSLAKGLIGDIEPLVCSPCRPR